METIIAIRLTQAALVLNELPGELPIVFHLGCYLLGAEVIDMYGLNPSSQSRPTSHQQ